MTIYLINQYNGDKASNCYVWICKILFLNFNVPLSFHFSCLPYRNHHHIDCRNINIFNQLLRLMCCKTFFGSHVLTLVLNLLIAFLTKNSDNTKMPNHRNYKLINASNYWSNFPTQIFLPFSFFFISASFSPSFDVSCILFIYKNNNFELQISVLKFIALWQLLFSFQKFFTNNIFKIIFIRI